MKTGSHFAHGRIHALASDEQEQQVRSTLSSPFGRMTFPWNIANSLILRFDKTSAYCQLLVEEALANGRRAISFHGKILLMLSHSIGQSSSMLSESIGVVVLRLFLRAL